MLKEAKLLVEKVYTIRGPNKTPMYINMKNRKKLIAYINCWKEIGLEDSSTEELVVRMERKKWMIKEGTSRKERKKIL
jgi:hypothetical protein